MNNDNATEEIIRKGAYQFENYDRKQILELLMDHTRQIGSILDILKDHEKQFHQLQAAGYKQK